MRSYQSKYNIGLEKDDKESSSETDDDVAGSDATAVHMLAWKNPLNLFFVLVMVVSVSTSPLTAKLSYSYDTWPCKDHDCEPEKFQGFMGQCYWKYVFMIGMNAVFWYWLDGNRRKKGKPMYIHGDIEFAESEGMKMGWKRYLWIYPGSLGDLTATLFERTATRYVKASTMVLLGCSSIFVGAIGRAIFEKQGMLVCEYIGLTLLIGTIAFGSVDASEDLRDTEHPALGLSLALAGGICRGLQFVWHNNIRKMYFPQCYQSFIESSFTLIQLMILSVVFHLTGFVDIYKDFWATVSSTGCLAWVILFGFTAATFQIGAVVVSRYICGTMRLFILRACSLITWILEMSIGFGIFSVWELFSVIFLFIGCIMFGGLIASNTRMTWLLHYPGCMCCCLKPPPAAIIRDNNRRNPETIYEDKAHLEL